MGILALKTSNQPVTPVPAAPTTMGTNRFNTPLTKPLTNVIPAQSWLAYNWIDKDPELDFVCWAIQASGWSIEKIEAETEKCGHRVSRGTIYNWLYGDVKRPQNVTMNTVMSVLGYERTWKQGVRR